MNRANCFLLLLALLLLSVHGSCSGGGGGSSSGGTVTPASFVQISSNRLDGGPATDFQLAATISGNETPTSIDWDFGDGRTDSGASVVIAYATPGVYTVQVTANFPNAGARSAELDVTVLDPQGGDVIVGTDLPMPPLLGDVDGDVMLTQLDVTGISDHVQGTTLLDPAVWRAADYHLDGRIDQLDVDLLTDAVNQGGLLPDSIEPLTGPRGTMARLVSNRLRDVNALIEVRVGSAPLFA